MANLLNSPTVGTIDQNGLLTLNWQPVEVVGDPAYADYADWNIWLTSLPNGTPALQNIPGAGLPTGLEPAGSTLDSRSFVTQLPSAVTDWTVSMQALSSNPTAIGNAPTWDQAHEFPSALVSSTGNLVTLSTLTPLLNESLTITLSPTYEGADSWRAVFADGSASAWLPVGSKLIVKAFSVAGPQPIIIQALNDFSSSTPGVKLMRQLALTAFVINQEFTTGSPNTALGGALGFGGETGFEIATAGSGGSLTLNDYMVIVRALVRDTVTNELKLLVATSRTANASSLLGTMAIDVFPLAGRPHTLDLVDPGLYFTTTAATTLTPVQIATQTLPNVIVGQSMQNFSMQVQSGSGVSPYAWYAENLPFGITMTVDGTISGTPLELGTFQVTFAVEDSSNPGFIAEVTLPLVVVSNLTIVTTSLPSATVMTPYSVQMVSSGGLAPVTWQLANGTFPGGLSISPSGLISGIPVTYNSTTDFSKTYTVTIQVTDSIGVVTSEVLSLSLLPAALQLGPPDQPLIFAQADTQLVVPVFGGKAPYSLIGVSDGSQGIVGAPATYSLVNGQVEILLHPSNSNNGQHSLTISLSDSNTTPSYATASVPYTVATQISPIELSEAVIQHDWAAADSFSVSYPIVGSLNGLTLAALASVTFPSGQTATINPTAGTVTFSGPPVTFGNSEADVSLVLQLGASNVATITRHYTVISHNTNGNRTINPRPYIAGDPVAGFVGLNIQSPYFNSPEVSLAGSTVQLLSGQALPQGLSLDSVTGLIYGNVLAANVTTNTFTIVNAAGASVGTITVNWNILPTSFSFTDNSGMAQTQVAYTGYLLSNSTSPLVSAGIASGRLPVGLSVAVDSTATQIQISGTTTESGYFDVWFQATNAAGQQGYFYKRFGSQYIAPLIIQTDQLAQAVTGEAYAQPLNAIGGITPYNWSITSGALPAGITLNATSGLLSGTPTVTSYTQNLAFQVTDERGVSTSVTLSLVVNPTLRVTTTRLPNAAVGQAYPGTSSGGFQLQAAGGIAPYTWQLISGNLPGGLSMSPVGLITGTTVNASYNQNLTFQVTDSASNTASAVLNLQVSGVQPLTIVTTGVGSITRGGNYQGTLRANGPGTTPYLWSVTPDSPNPLPAGLYLTADVSTSGVTASITGVTTASLTNYPVKVAVVDQVGNSSSATLSLNSVSSLAITTASLPQGIVSATYSTQLAASGFNTPFTWSLDPSSPALPTGFALNSSGLLYGTSSVVYSQTIVVRVTDSIGEYTTASFSLSIQASTLAITTTSLPQVTGAVAYSATLTCTGGVPAYVWSISPSSSNQLPAGLSLNSSTGVISGSTTSIGTTQITFRVTDTTGVYKEVTLALTVRSGVALHSGIDWVNATSTNALGHIANGNAQTVNPRPNLTFIVVATGLISTSASQLQFNLPTGFSASPAAIANGDCLIGISGPFATTPSQSLNFSLTDAGVTVSATYTWVIVPSRPLRLTSAGGGGLPTLYLE
jgi:hypothetical protein